MILFHAKRDGTVTTTPNFVPQGSSMQDLVVVSEFDYAYCAIKLYPASGEYIEDIPCTPILQKDYSTIFTAALPPKATVVAGSVDYQLVFTAADGTTQTTLAGSFTVPRGVPVSTPGSVEELSVKTVGDLYAIMVNTYGLFVGHERDIYQSLADIAALKKTVSSAGYVTIPVSQWEDGTPTIATFTLDGFGAGMTAMLIPADSNTQTAAREARLSAYPVAFPIDSDTQTVEIIRADADKAPKIPLRFAYLILKTDTSVAPTVAILGVDAYGEGGGTASGVDESAVRAIITAMLGNVANERQYSAKNPPPYPVTSVNGNIGAVNLNAEDVGARPSTWMPTAADVGADPANTAETKTAALRDEVNGKLADYDKSTAVNNKISSHNTSTESHADLRLELQRLADRINAALNSTDTSLDDLKEIVAYIKANKTLIDGITSSKVNVTDIVNNLTTNTANVPLSAAQGVVLKLLIDSLEDVVEGKTTPEQVAAQIKAALTDYLDKEEAAELYQPKEDGKGLSTNDYTNADKAAVTKAASDSAAAVNTANQAKQSADTAKATALEIKAMADGGELDGKDGTTPIPGVDYPTTEQMQAYAASLASDTTKVVTSVEEMTDTAKLYLMVRPEDGALWYYASQKVIIPGGELIPKNALETSIGTDGAIFNGGLGYKTDTRLSSNSGGESSATGFITSGFIPMPYAQNSEIRIKGVVGNSSSHAIIWCYDRSFTKVGVAIPQNAWITPDENGVCYCKPKAVNRDFDYIAYIRFCGIPTATAEDVICTIDKEITYTQPGEKYEWKAIQPKDATDHTADILALQQADEQHTADIAALKKAVENVGSEETTYDEALERIKTWDKPVYDEAPVTLLGDDRVKAALTSADFTIEAIYARYRALRDDPDHPENALYITETRLGPSTISDLVPDFTGKDILRFDFKEPDGLTEVDDPSTPKVPDPARETKPKIIFISGIHKEWAGVYGLYYALEEIATNPDFDDIRRNAHIIVIPCANPFGMIATSDKAVNGWVIPKGWASHVNANGIAPHNNFGVNFKVQGEIGKYNYGGTEAYSELETQYIDKVVSENPDAIAFITCHNYQDGGIFGDTVMWASSATYHMCNLVYRLVDKMSKAWITKYGTPLKQAIDAAKHDVAATDYRLGCATMSTSAGTEQANATKYGILATNLEISDNWVVFTDKAYSPEAMTHGAETYANFIRTILRAYDNNDRKEYAPTPAYTVE